MTNKEAAEFIWDVLDGVKSFNEEGGRGLEALELAIKALKNEKAKESEIVKAYTKGFDTGVKTVKNERPQGEWEKCQNDMFRCSICRQADEVPTSIGIPIYNFCPYCGAEMRGAE